MTIDELLHETAPDHDHLRARTSQLRADVLARAVLSRPDRHPRRRTAVGAVAGAVLSLSAVGGVAYATGSVPDLVTSSVEDFAEQIGVSGDHEPQMRQVTDLALPDGSRFAVWSGRSDAMVCTTYLDQWDGTSRPKGNGGGSCDDQLSDANRSSLAWAQGDDATTYYPVLFGGAEDGVVEVRVYGTFGGTGEPVDLVLPVDPTTDSFAGTLPGTSGDPWPTVDPKDHDRDSGLTLSFVGADGDVLQTVDDLAY